MTGSLILYDGVGGSSEFVNDSHRVLTEFNPPIFERDDQFVTATGVDGERRTSTRNQNGQGSASLYFWEDEAADFWAALDEFQRLVESAHRNRGYLRYTPPSGEAVEYELEAITLTDFPQRGTQLQQRGASISVSFKCLSGGLLDWTTLKTDVGCYGLIDFIDVSVPGHLDAIAELTFRDDSGSGFDCLEVGIGPQSDGMSVSCAAMDLLYNSASVAGPNTQRWFYNSLSSALGVDTPRAEKTIAAPTGPVKVTFRGSHTGTSSNPLVRMGHRFDGGEVTFGPWQELRTGGVWAWYEVDLGTIFPSEGSESLTLVLDVKGGDLAATLYGDALSIAPATRHLTLTSLPVPPAALSRFSTDEFSTNTGAIGGSSKTITGATNATPIVVTSASHGLNNGDVVWISGVGGNLAANGFYVIANKTANTFELAGSAGSGAYTSGGTAQTQGRAGDSGQRWFSSGAGADFTVGGGVISRTQATASGDRFALIRASGTQLRANLMVPRSDFDEQNFGLAIHTGLKSYSIVTTDKNRQLLVCADGVVLKKIRGLSSEWIPIQIEVIGSMVRLSVPGGSPDDVVEVVDDAVPVALSAGRLGVGLRAKTLGSNSDVPSADRFSLDLSSAAEPALTLPPQGKVIIDERQNQRFDATDDYIGGAAVVRGDYLRLPPGPNRISLLARGKSIERAESDLNKAWMSPNPIAFATLRVRPRVTVLGSAETAS